MTIGTILVILLVLALVGAIQHGATVVTGVMVLRVVSG